MGEADLEGSSPFALLAVDQLRCTAPKPALALEPRS